MLIDIGIHIFADIYCAKLQKTSKSLKKRNLHENPFVNMHKKKHQHNQKKHYITQHREKKVQLWVRSPMRKRKKQEKLNIRWFYCILAGKWV